MNVSSISLEGRLFAGVENSATGVCASTIEILEDGLLRLHGSWAWESRLETGHSIVEELEQ